MFTLNYNNFNSPVGFNLISLFASLGLFNNSKVMRSWCNVIGLPTCTTITETTDYFSEEPLRLWRKSSRKK